MSVESVAEIRRLLIRAVTEFIAAETGRLSVRHEGNLTRAALFLAYSQSARPQPPRTLSVRAAAASLLIPYETARRLTMELAQRGLVERADDGAYFTPRAVLDHEDATQSSADSFADLQTMMAALEALGIDLDQFERDSAAKPEPPPPAIRLAAGEGARVKALIDAFDLRMMENSAKHWGSVFDGCMFCMVSQQIAGQLNRDPVLAWTYASAPPPAEAWAVATVAETALRMVVPRETVRRHFERLVREGYYRRLKDGYQITTECMNSPPVIEAGGNLVFYAVQLIRQLRAMGVGAKTAGA